MNLSASKPVRATRVKAGVRVTVDLDENTADALTYARQYLLDLPRLTEEVTRAGNAVTGEKL